MEDEKNDATKNVKGSVDITKCNILSNLYSQFGYRDLYEIAASTIPEIKRVQVENVDIMGAVDLI